MLLALAVLAAQSPWSAPGRALVALAMPCVPTLGGKMLCCAADDMECLEKVQKAHGGKPQAPPPAVAEPPRPWLLGSVHTFANVSVWDRVSPFDVAVVGVPFGLEAGYEAPGMQLLRREAQRIQPYSRLHGASLEELKVVDGQDLLAGGAARVAELEAAAAPFFRTGRPLVALGGDQSITVPLLRAASKAATEREAGPFAIVHIDKDLATGSGSMEEELGPHSALFWAAAGALFETRHSLHVGARGNLPSQRVELIDQEIGFQTLSAEDVAMLGVSEIVKRIRQRLTRRDGTVMPAYLSVDLDVLDPASFARAGPEVGGLSVSQLRALLAGLRPFCQVVGAEVRGVGPLYEPEAIRVAAAIAHDLVLLAGKKQESREVVPPPLRATSDL